jgi:cholesterol oxidase
MAQGVAISSSIHPEPTTHVEVVKYGSGQDALFPLSVPMIDGGPLRALRFLLTVLRHPVSFIRSMWPVGGADRSVILLVMQSLDNSLTSFRKRGRLTTKQGTGKPNPTWIPIGHKVARLFASKVKGDAGAVGTDVLNIPATAHYIGGAVIGDSPATGVIDPWQRVYGHDGLHVIDGSAVTANLGVNPSLTITAQAERALAFWPNKGEQDPRPPLGSTYVRVAPVAPHQPAVPATASGALRVS